MSNALINRFKDLQLSVLREWVYRIGFLLFALLLFFFAIDLMVQTTASITNTTFNDLVSVTRNPFISFFIGILSTAILQSSSTTTSMVVAMVASGTVPFTSGIYIIMGANIGTTITSDIISLAYIIRKNEFQRALASATIHDFFNILTAAVILPLEYYYHLLSRIALYISGFFSVSHPQNYNFHPGILTILTPVSNWLINLVGNAFVPLVIGILLLFLAIKFMTQIIYKTLIGDSREKLKRYIFNNPLKSFSWGFMITGALQSSSITTSLIVPLTATGKILLPSVFPFIMGANVGTTITALMASMFKSQAAISIAIAHFMFNVLGTLIFLPFAPVRNFVVRLAERFSFVASRRRINFFIYILLTFFLIPFLLIYLSK
jgi:solute carrier family 34 (sodium-dependent phosphate cotransporter)